MSLRPIQFIPAAVLLETAQAVEEVTPDIVTLLDDMVETMYAEEGVGLAGNQIAVLKRVVVIDVSGSRTGSHAYQMINPEIVSLSEETAPYSEGCLSIPGVHRDVIRPVMGVFRYQDIHGEIQEIEAEGILARCLQHEIDHLNGTLFIDYLSKLKRNMIWKSFSKKAKFSENDT